MKNKSLKLFDKLVMALLGLFPFLTACDEVRMMYGTPTADYQIKGTVSDELLSTPIKEIRIVFRDSRDSLFLYADTVFTDSNGKYAFNFSNPPDPYIQYELKATDIDGTANGGEYSEETVTTLPEDATWDKSKTEDWYSGKITIVKDIKLSKE